MTDRNFYERRLGNPGYDAVARKKIKQLEKMAGGGAVVFDVEHEYGDRPEVNCSHSLEEAYDQICNMNASVIVRLHDVGYGAYCIVNGTKTLCEKYEEDGKTVTSIYVEFDWITPNSDGGINEHADAYIDYRSEYGLSAQLKEEK